MNILWVTGQTLDVSLSGVTHIEIVKNLEQLGYRVLLLGGFKKEKPAFGLAGRIRYVRVINLKGLSYFIFELHLFFSLACYLFHEKPDFTVIEPGHLGALPFAMLRRIRGIKTRFVLDIRTVPVEVFGVSGKLKEMQFNLSVFAAKYLFDGISVITPFMKEVLARRFELENDKIGIWTSGVSSVRFDPQRVSLEQVGKLREKLGLMNRFTVIYHGVFTPSRGLKEAIVAISMVRQKHKDIALLLVGDGPSRSDLQKMISVLNLEDTVIMTGPVPHREVPSHIALADVGILPFPPILWWRVSSPIKLMEYLAMEKPVVVTDIEAHRDVINSHELGVFIPSNRPRDIAQGILEAYAKRQQLREFGKEGRRLVRDSYTWSRQARKLEKYLKSVC